MLGAAGVVAHEPGRLADLLVHDPLHPRLGGVGRRDEEHGVDVAILSLARAPRDRLDLDERVVVRRAKVHDRRVGHAQPRAAALDLSDEHAGLAALEAHQRDALLVLVLLAGQLLAHDFLLAERLDDGVLLIVEVREYDRLAVVRLQVLDELGDDRATLLGHEPAVREHIGVRLSPLGPLRVDDARVEERHALELRVLHRRAGLAVLVDGRERLLGVLGRGDHDHDVVDVPAALEADVVDRPLDDAAIDHGLERVGLLHATLGEADPRQLRDHLGLVVLERRRRDEPFVDGVDLARVLRRLGLGVLEHVPLVDDDAVPADLAVLRVDVHPLASVVLEDLCVGQHDVRARRELAGLRL